MLNPIIDIAQTVLANHCSEFLIESNGHPLLRNLPLDYNSFSRVKVRQRNVDTRVATIFNEAFAHVRRNLFQSAIIANGTSSFRPLDNGFKEPFFVFPINGFKFLYCEQIANTNTQYEKSFSELIRLLGDETTTSSIISEQMQNTYVSERLSDGISSGSQILIHNIPYFYAVRASLIDYSTLIAIDK